MTSISNKSQMLIPKFGLLFILAAIPLSIVGKLLGWSLSSSDGLELFSFGGTFFLTCIFLISCKLKIMFTSSGMNIWIGNFELVQRPWSNFEFVEESDNQLQIRHFKNESSTKNIYIKKSLFSNEEIQFIKTQLHQNA